MTALPQPPQLRRQHSTPAEVRKAIRCLTDAAAPIRVHDWPAGLQGLDQAGLYCWSVDAGGAVELSRGLGSSVRPGRIYVGLTGATKWPSGKIGAMTLRQRIGSNHLRGTVRSSTFRRTLAAALATPLGLQAAAGGRLARESENALTSWMHKHLAVAVHPYPHRDALADLERAVLDSLDPPMNLDGRPRTPLRARLSELRASLQPQPLPRTEKSPAPTVSRRATSRDVAAGQPTLHAEIAEILRASTATWMTTAAIADLVNARRRYSKKDGSPVTPFQIHGRTRRYPNLFKREGARVALAE